MRFFNRMLNKFYIKFCVMKELTINDLPASKMDDWWKEHNDEYYHYLYRIDNTENKMFYYGIHSQRKDSGKIPENDGYMGSGAALLKAQKKYGMKKFTKTVLKIFSTRDEARLEEIKIVDDSLVKDRKCYNLTIGGSSTPNFTGMGVYMNKDNHNDIRHLPIDDPLVLSKQFIGVSTGKAVYKNKDNSDDIRKLPVDDPLVTSGQFIFISTGFGIFKNKGNPNDIRQISIDDPLVLSGQFIGVMKGIKQDKESILKKTMDRNGSWGTMWITDGINTKKIKKSDKIPDGWKLGRSDQPSEYININTKEHRWFRESDSMDKTVWKQSIIFVNEELIEPDDLIKLYNSKRSWKKVSKELGISKEKVKGIRNYYEKHGYKFPKRK